MIHIKKNIDKPFFITIDLSFKNEEFQEGTKKHTYLIMWLISNSAIV